MQSRLRHLNSRLGFTPFGQTGAATRQDSLEMVLQEAFGVIRQLPSERKPAADGYRQKSGNGADAGGDEQQRRMLRQQQQQMEREAYADFGIRWLGYAREPGNSAQEKLVLFFQNVWVVAFQGVRDAAALEDYHRRIRLGLSGSYPDLCKSLARSPAMLRYLNLNQNRKGAPNENFARELFELFCLGEGNYSEQDIKEAARALTGYVVDADGTVRFVARRHDRSSKTIFGERGSYDLDGLVDLVFRQPAAARFLPTELARYYLAAEGLPADALDSIAVGWRQSGFSIPWLIRTFFTSEAFYAESSHGNLIKSPIHFYLGLLQDLELDVFPSPRLSLNPLRTMGQAFFNPPNVRGWVGGRQWINSATLAARNQLVESLLQNPARMRLNADEEAALAKAEAVGKGRFSVASEWVEELGEMDFPQLAQTLALKLHADPRPEVLQPILRSVATGLRRRARGLACLKAALCCPAYHLC